MAPDFPDRRSAATQIVVAARRLAALGLVVARQGNLSVRLAEDRVLATPAGARKGELDPGGLVELDLQGAWEGPVPPSSEIAMHLAIYRLRPDAGAVVHAHPPFATAFAAARLDLDAKLLPEASLLLGEIALVPYSTPGSEGLASAVGERAREHHALLLANHGVACFAGDVDTACAHAETLEHLAQVSLRARALGGGIPLDPGELADLEELRGRYGKRPPATGG